MENENNEDNLEKILYNLQITNITNTQNVTNVTEKNVFDSNNTISFDQKKDDLHSLEQNNIQQNNNNNLQQCNNSQCNEVQQNNNLKQDDLEQDNKSETNQVNTNVTEIKVLIDKNCPICWTIPLKMIKLECKHHLCTNCLDDYVKEKIEEKSCEVVCPFEDCEECINIIDFITNDDILTDYENLFATILSYTTALCNICNRRCKKMHGKVMVYCQYDNDFFCSLCRAIDCNGNHPTSEESDFDETLDDDNIQKCPRCLILLVKEAGCDAVKCPHCKIKFCWNCLKTNFEIRNEASEIHDCRFFDEYRQDTDDDESSDGENID